MMTGTAAQVTAAAENVSADAYEGILFAAGPLLGEGARTSIATEIETETGRGIARLNDMPLPAEGGKTHPLCLLLLTSDARWLTLLARKRAGKHRSEIDPRLRRKLGGAKRWVAIHNALEKYCLTFISLSVLLDASPLVAHPRSTCHGFVR